MATSTRTFQRWIVEGSNGQLLFGPASFSESMQFLHTHQARCRESYSAEGPPPSHLVKAWDDSRLGYLLRKVNVQVVESYE